MDKFDQIKLNQVAEVSHTITEDDIQKFVDLTDTSNFPLCIDVVF